MKIHIPKDFGDELALLPDGSCTAVVKDISGKKNAKTGNYQMYVKWIVTSEMYKDDDQKTTVGETVLDAYALVDKALWRLNDTCIGLVGKSLNDIFTEFSGAEEGDIEPDELIKLLAGEFKGREAHLLLEAETYEGKTRTKVKAISNEPLASSDSNQPEVEIP